MQQVENLTQESGQVKKESKIKQILDSNNISQAEFCRLIYDATGHYCSYHNMNLIYRGRYNSSVSLTRARAFVTTLNGHLNSNFNIDDLFD
jgi:hypothetical protein